MEYNIEFKNDCDAILGTITGIRNNISLYCTDDYAKSSSVTMWAVRKGVSGIRSKVALFTTPKTTVTVKKGMHFVFFVFFIFRRNQIKGLSSILQNKLLILLPQTVHSVKICENI